MSLELGTLVLIAITLFLILREWGMHAAREHA